MTTADLDRLAARGATLVTCPRSNGHTGAGAPPIEEFYTSGVRVAVGTDSLASAPDLNVFAELATMRALAPSVPAARCSTARRGRAPARSASTPITARSSPASGAPAGRRRFRRAPTMWKNIWWRDRAGQIRWIDDLRCRLAESQSNQMSLWIACDICESAINLHASAICIAMQCTMLKRVASTPRSCASATRCSRCRLRWPGRCWPRSGAGADPAAGCARASRLVWILVAMVAARSAAMGFNRLVDARDRRAEPAHREPRAAARRDEHARSRRVRRRRVGGVRLRGVAAEPAVLRAVAGRAGDRVLVLAGQALHHLDAAVPRAGDGGGAGRRLAGGRRPRRLGAVAAGAAIGTWVGGFDVLYACQDLDFDRAHGLRSIPVRFGVPASLAISRVHARRRGRLPGRAGVGRAARPRLSRRRRRRGGAARLRAVAGARRRPVAGEARLRPERLRRHPLSARAGGVDVCR